MQYEQSSILHTCHTNAHQTLSSNVEAFVYMCTHLLKPEQPKGGSSQFQRVQEVGVCPQIYISHKRLFSGNYKRDHIPRGSLRPCTVKS